MADLVQVAVESSWEVRQGSLESGVSVVFLDPVTLDPLVPPSPPPSPGVRKLVLARPQDSSVPCEITVKFQGRLCSVHSFYSLSTSRICELYSRASLQMDPDYVCTVRGWVPDTETATTEEDAEGVNSPECSSKLLCQDHTNKDACGECRSDIAAHFCFSEDTHILTGRVIENTEPIVSSVRGIGTVTSKSLAKAEEDDFQRSVYSSGDDSWVEVKLSKSINGKFPDKSSTVSQNIEGELDSNQDGTEDCNDAKQRMTMLTPHNMEVLQSEDGSNPTLDQLAHQNVSHHSEKDFQSSGCSGCGLGQCRMYEAELELVDHDPWAAVTIRCLSLQDKSCVEIDQMVFLAVQTPLVSSSNRANQMSDSGGSSALLAMLIPSMLQMVRGVSDQRAQEPCFGRSQTTGQDVMKFDKELQTRVQSDARSSTCDETLVQENEANVLADNPCVSSYKKIIDTNLEVVDEDIETIVAAVNAGGDASKGHKQNVSCGVPQNVAVETVCHSQTGHATSHVDMLTNSKVSGEQTEQCHVETSSNQKAQPHSLESKRDLKEDESYPKENFLTVLETFSDRFDRLEAICVRMELYLHRAVESLDGRLLALERECFKASTEAPMASREVEVETGFSNSSITSESNCKDVDAPVPVQTDGQASPGKAVVYAEAPVDFKDIQINSRKESLVSELGEDLQIKEPIAYEALVGGSSTLSEQPLREKPCVSLDDAWASALSAFSSLNEPSVIHSSHEKVTCRDFFESSESEECSISQPASFISISAPPPELDGSTLDENDIFCTEDIMVDATKPQAETLTESPWYSYYASSPSTKKATSLFCEYGSSSEDETADLRDDKRIDCEDGGRLNKAAESQHSLIDDSPERSYARDEWFRPNLPLSPEGDNPIGDLCWSEPLSPVAHTDSCNIVKQPKGNDLIVDLLSFPESSPTGVEVSGDKAALKKQRWESDDMHTANSEYLYGPGFNQTSPKTGLGNLLVEEGRSAFQGVGTLCDSDMYLSQEFDLFQENLSTDNWTSRENPSSVREPAGSSMETVAGLEELFSTYLHGSQSGGCSSSSCPLPVPENCSHEVKQDKLETVPADVSTDRLQSCMVFPGFEIFS